MGLFDDWFNRSVNQKPKQTNYDLGDESICTCGARMYKDENGRWQCGSCPTSWNSYEEEE